ncbi:EpsG family protein [Chitinophaga sp. Hz27]|uniref:EpsG family protein n=1 Tax=Chitinophaga sp. Hz27 TaxID=3347169 RepID=UPI0035DE6EF7
MLIVIIFLILSAFSFYRRDNGLTIKLVMIFLAGISIFLSSKSSDFPIYEGYYEKVQPLYTVLRHWDFSSFDTEEKFEIGYALLNSFFKMFTAHVAILYIFSNAFILLLIYIFIRKKTLNSYKVLLPYFVFVFISIQVGIIRQAISIAIFFFCIRFIISKDFWRYAIGIILAGLFHRTALFLLPLYFLANRKFSNRLLWIIFGIGLMIYMQIIPFSPLTLLEGTANIFLPSIGDKLVFYLFQNKQLGAPSKFTQGIFENAIVFCLLIWARKELIKKGQYDSFLNVCFNFAILYIFIYIYLFDLYTFIYRLNYFFVFFKFMIIAKYIESLEWNYNRFIGTLLLIFYCAIMLTIRLIQGY